MNARLLDVLHDAGDENRLAVRERVDVDLDGVREIAVEQQRIGAEHRVDLPGLVVGIARLDVGWHEARQHAEEIIVERAGVMNDRHRTTAEHIRGTNDQRQAKIGGDQPRLLDRIGDCVLRLLEAELVEQALKAVAILGKIDRVHRRAEDRRARLLDRARELQRRLTAELHNHALQFPRLPLLGEDRQHVLRGQRFEIEPVRCVVIRRHRLRIAVDHDCLVARVAKRKRGVAAAIVKLDALPDPVGTAAENDHLGALRRPRFTGRRPVERRLVGRVHIGGGRSEFRRAGVDALVDGLDAERRADRRNVLFRDIGERA